jgi:hypothetical protein
LTDTATSSLTGLYPSGDYYGGKYDDGDFLAVVSNQRIPIKSFDPTNKKWTLSRTIDGISSVPTALAYQVYHRKGHGDFIQAGVGLTVNVKGSTTFPFVGNADGTVKVRQSDYSLALPADSTVYIFMSTLVGVNGIDEDEPTFFYRSSNVEDERSVLIGKVVTGVASITTITCYDLNAEYDTLWVKFDSSATGNTQAAGSDYTFTGRVGNTKRRYDAKVLGLIAPDSSNAPDLTNIGQVAFDPTLYVKKVLDESFVLKTTNASYQSISLPFWLRFVVY